VVIDRNVLEWRMDPSSPWHHEAVRSHDQPVIVMCDEGYQSSLAAAALVDLGFSAATDLDGGFRAWRAAGLPVVENVPDLVGLLDELQAIGRAGLSFADDPFDRERYERLVSMAAQGYAAVGEVTEHEVRERFASEVGCITPKVGADAVLVDDDGRVLLIERADDRRWGLVSGWVEPNEHPADTVVREAREEVGLDIRVDRLVGVFARPAGATTGPHSVVSVVYRATILGGELTPAPHEVLQARWWPVDDVPVWHMDHEQFARAALEG